MIILFFHHICIVYCVKQQLWHSESREKGKALMLKKGDQKLQIISH